ncbi:MAG TPA: penicillin-insensitive murein endopeptidase, partial [Nannocystaceae bacterium]|nr:penicillin-insensitive murein endopeptidase [Nannocystaceae bacterium]
MRFIVFATWLGLGQPAEPLPPPNHVVVAGDNLWELARKHGCTVEQVRAVNPGLGESLRVGSKILLQRCIVRPASRARTPDPKAAPPKPREAKPEPRAKAEPRTEPTTPKKPPKVVEVPTHRVVAGDTLSSIARAHKTTVKELQAINGLKDTTIVLGQRLQLARGPAPDDVDLDTLPTPPASLKELPKPPDDDAPRARDDDDDELAEVGKDPGSVGRPDHGRLIGAVQLPADKIYYLRHPKRAWGVPHVVGSTRDAIAAVKKKYPSVHRLAIGDISAQRGGRLSGHRSHQSGRDVDLGLYFERVPKSYPKRFVAAHAGDLDLGATWALVEAFWRQSKRPGGPVAIFLDFEVQGRLYQWARKHGVSRRTLLEVFQYPHGRWARKGLVRHEPAHDDHLHVRFGCPPRD